MALDYSVGRLRKTLELWAGRVIECYRKSPMGLFVSSEDSNVESGGPDRVSERSKDFIRNWTRSRLWATLMNLERCPGKKKFSNAPKHQKITFKPTGYLSKFIRVAHKRRT